MRTLVDVRRVGVTLTVHTRRGVTRRSNGTNVDAVLLHSVSHRRRLRMVVWDTNCTCSLHTCLYVASAIGHGCKYNGN